MLTRRDLTRLLVRIFGLIILASAVVGLPLSINTFAIQLSVWDAGRAIYTWQDVPSVGVVNDGYGMLNATGGQKLSYAAVTAALAR